MYRLIAAICIFALFAGPGGPVRASEGCPVPDGMIAELLGWIADNSGYSIRTALENPPDVQTCATGDVIEYEHEAAIIDEGIRALYDFEARLIYLVDPWNPDNPRDRSILLHELIHVVQLDNREWECIGAPEWEAYKLHEAWLNEQGLEADFDWLRIYFVSRCPRDIHPD